MALDKKTLWTWGAVLGVGGLIAWMLTKKASAAQLPAVSASGAASDFATGLPTVSIQTMGLPSGLAQASGALNAPIYETATSAPTSSGIASSNSFFANLPTTLPSPGSGWVVTPEGSQVPATLIPWKQDASGNTYVLWGVDVYQITGQDGQGNYLTTVVPGTSSAFELTSLTGG